MAAAPFLVPTLVFLKKGWLYQIMNWQKPNRYLIETWRWKKFWWLRFPKKTVTFGEGTEIFKLFYKIDAPQSAYFVFNRFHFGKRGFADNVNLIQPSIYQLAKIVKNYQKLSHNNLWMTDRRLIVGIKKKYLDTSNGYNMFLFHILLNIIILGRSQYNSHLYPRVICQLEYNISKEFQILQNFYGIDNQMSMKN